MLWIQKLYNLFKNSVNDDGSLKTDTTLNGNVTVNDIKSNNKIS